MSTGTCLPPTESSHMKRTLVNSAIGIAILAFMQIGPATASGLISAKPTTSPSASAKPSASTKPKVSSTPKASVTPSKSPKANPSQSAKPSTSPSPKFSGSPSASPTSSKSPVATAKPTPKRIILPKPVLDPPPRSLQVDKAIAYALLQVGKPYVRGATGPKSFDCSGLMQRAWQAAGISLPRTSGQQFNSTIHIDISDALPGDLVFYGQNGVQHVAMYIGFGLIVEAANPERGVVISPISTPWHNNNFGGIGRVSAPQSPITQP